MNETECRAQTLRPAIAGWMVRRETCHTVSLIEPHLRPEGTLLDIGCGAGYVSWLLSRRRPGEVHALDIVDQRRVELPRFQLFDGIHLPAEEGRYDAVLLSFVLHHVPDDDKERLLAEVRRVVRGTVVILEDTPRTWLDHLLSHRHGEQYRRSIGSSAAYGFLGRQEWEQLFARLGFAVRHSRELGRFCRDWTQPYARTLFVLDRES